MTVRDFYFDGPLASAVAAHDDDKHALCARLAEQAVVCRCGSPVVGWGSGGKLCESCWEDASDFARDELRAEAEAEAEVEWS